jgi:hypothetical protein
MTPAGETHMQMARRHVREGEARVQRQRVLIGRLHDLRADTSTAEQLLAEFEHSLDDHRTSLDRLIEEQRAGRRDAAGDIVF